MRLRVPVVLLVAIGLAVVRPTWAGTEYVLSSSDLSEGPPYAELDLSGGERIAPEADGEGVVSLPFAFPWFGEARVEARVGADGVLLFGDGGADDAPQCPADDGAWSGIAPLWGDLGEGELRQATFGRYPYRAWAVEWRAPDATAGGEGRAQVWLLEGRDEAVISLPDLSFSEAGDSSADGGARAVIGAEGPGQGLPWSCDGGLEDGSAAWIGPATARPASPERGSGDLPTWAGAAIFQYAGRSLAVGDVQGDGWDDLVIGEQDQDRAYVILGGPGEVGGSLEDASAALEGAASEDVGTALALGDLDGDGALELALGAPASDTVSSNAGAVYVVSGAALPTALTLTDDADLILLGPDGGGKPSAGSALAAVDLDGDGYADLAVGAPRADILATDAGAVYLWGGASDALAGSASLSDSPGVLRGATAQDQAGRALGAADLDGDGAGELLVGAPYADRSSSATNAGRLYVVGGGALADGSLSSVSRLVITGAAADDRLGLAMAGGDLDGDGLGDLAVGAPYVDGGASGAGVVYLYAGAGGLSGALDAADADATITATETSANLGAALAMGDLSGAGHDDLVVAAPNARGEAADAGVVGVFSTLDAGDWTLDEADHLLLGADSAGALGTAVAVAADHDGDGYPDLIASAPYASPGDLSRAGAAYTWSFVPSFLDADADGFVSVAAGGIDCDDGDAGVYPGTDEIPADNVDEDCDGWVDGVVVPRAVSAWWVWDIDAELGAAEPPAFDFEDASEGDDVAGLYLDDDLILEADGDIAATALVWDSLPSGALGARVRAGSTGNGLRLRFGASVDALAFQVLDASDPLAITAWSGDDASFEDLLFSAVGPDRTGGVFTGFTFASSVDEVYVQSISDDAWGVDDIKVVWSADTDRDLDGYTDNAGDCDDDDAAVNPDAPEILGNGVDDDCDGVIDGGGLSLYEDEATWEADAALVEQIIDFEDAIDGEAITTKYADLGATFSDGLAASADIDGSAPDGALGGAWSGETLRISFDERQSALALWALDVGAPLQITGALHGTDLYDVTVNPEGEDTAGGVFLGLVFDYGVDTLEIRSDSAFDVLGLDDLVFAELGLDDADGDGYTERDGDCDDHEAEAHPGADETWYDGVDEDCDGASDYDADGDGFEGGSSVSLDCDDEDAEISPDAPETWYDGVDEDCSGGSDYDADGDGHDDRDWGGDDCDDTDSEVSPDADEVWYDGVDEDCDGASDYDADGDGFVPSIFGAAIEGDDSVSAGDCDDDAALSFPGAEDEPYDGVDEDCAGDSDYDGDGDGHDAEVWGGDDCDDGNSTTFPGSTEEICYDGEDSDCLGDSDWDCDADGYELASHGGEDCDDSDADIHPGVTDAPRDGVDADCDGALEFDDDHDGWDGAEDGGEDCDDDDPDVHPTAEDACYDGLDADCAGDSDDDCDGDGHDADAVGGDDCDDADGTVHPGAIDYYYDGIDNDCDGEQDFDRDGDGVPASWYGGTDCDDADPAIYPGAAEIWYDGVDQDCANDDDDDQDGDGADGAGGPDCDDEDPEVGPAVTEIPLDGTDQDCDGLDDVDMDEDSWLSADDCDDTDPTAYPGAAETCYDGVDQDCDGLDVLDCDGDGWDGAAAGGEDCDDGDPEAWPGAPERWYDGIDEDCAGGDDNDQDGDGWAVDTLGGEDCDDTNARISPDRLLDECGAGDEDCDGEVDEDCPGDQDGAPTDAAEAGDTAWIPDSGAAGDSGEGEGEDGPTQSRPAEAQVVDQGCACASSGGGSWAVLPLLLLALRRRVSAAAGTRAPGWPSRSVRCRS